MSGADSDTGAHNTDFASATMRRRTIIVGAREALRIAVTDAMREGRHGHADALLLLVSKACAWIDDDLFQPESPSHD